MGLRNKFGWRIVIGFILVPVCCVIYFSGKPFVKCELVTQSEKGSIKYYNLPDEVTETSGILIFNGLIWTFNDSGGDAELFAWRMSDSSLVKRVTIWNAYNFDWEEITQDDDYIYIGDFGNNFGNRDNLCIYRIAKKAMLKTGNQAISAGKIQYTYPGYVSTSILSFARSAFDCEAMVCANDSIYLFSKDWVTKHSVVYALPSKPGKYTARKISEFNADGLVTSAAFDGKQLLLLGYKDFRVFLWKFKPFAGFALNAQNVERIELKELGGAQAEGLAIKNADTIYISNERSAIPQRLWVLKLD